MGSLGGAPGSFSHQSNPPTLGFRKTELFTIPLNEPHRLYASYNLHILSLQLKVFFNTRRMSNHSSIFHSGAILWEVSPAHITPVLPSIMAFITLHGNFFLTFLFPSWECELCKGRVNVLFVYQPVFTQEVLGNHWLTKKGQIGSNRGFASSTDHI